MNKSVVRSALLSARLFADARGHSQLRPEGPGVMDIKQALATLVREGSSAAEQRHCPWITRLRIAGGLREALDPDHRGDRGGIAEPAYRGAPNAVSDQLEQVAKADTAATLAARANEWGGLSGLVDQLAEAAKQHIPPAIADALAYAPGVRPDDGGASPFDWQTEVAIVPGGATKVSSYIEMTGASFPRLAQLCDPVRWAEGSMFWFESSRLDRDGKRLPPPPPLADGEAPTGWSGQLLEVVASTVAVFSAVLDIDFKVADNSCLVEYRLARPMSGLRTDEGYAYVTKVGEDRYRTQLVKWVDFQDAPFGGPSAMDQALPSYIGSWLRVQQDLWAAEAFVPE